MGKFSKLSKSQSIIEIKLHQVNFMSITRAFALLAPVPEIHLISGQEVCAQQGKVAFGSRVFELFRKLDTARGKDEIDVFIYASLPEESIGAMVSWQAVYVGHVEARRNGTHPAGAKLRPTTAYETDKPNSWVIYWEVRDLQPIDPFPIKSLRAFDKKAYYTPHFVPETPLLIEYP
jgi:hypothetical protein